MNWLRDRVCMRGSGSFLALLLVVGALSGCLENDEPQTQDPEAGDETALVPFVSQHTIVDPGRWSGEPSILVLEDGTILITGVAGFTRYAEDPADAPARFGQSYIWRSTDDGDTWKFVDAGLAPGPLDEYLFYRNAIMGVEGDLAADEAGRAYFVDLTMLASNGLSASDDAGATWTATQNPIVGLAGVDRPWVAAHGDGNVYVKYLQTATGHRVARSADAGLTFLEDVEIPSCSQADLTVDFSRGDILVPCSNDKDVSLLRTGPGAMDWQRLAVASSEYSITGGFPSAAVAGDGEYGIVYIEQAGEVLRVVVQFSFDAGQSWTEPVVVSAGNASAIFPWMDANPDGRVGVVWYQADQPGNPNDIDGKWTVRHATFELDSENSTAAGPVSIQVSEDVIHEGSICSAGLGCVVDGRAEDRRLLDFFEIDVAPDGRSHVTWTSTQTDVPTVWYGQVDFGSPAVVD